MHQPNTFLMVSLMSLTGLCLFGSGQGAAVGHRRPDTVYPLVFMGGPGAGKGTQARRVAARLGIAHISTGAILREEVSQGSIIGRKVEAVMARGELVADEIVLDLVEQRLRRADCARGFILDGFPRTLAQARGLASLLQRRGDPSLSVVLLDVSDAEMLQRLTERGRADDTRATVLERIRIFHEQSDDLVRFYQEQGRLIRIDGEQSIDEVFADILHALGVEPA